LVSPLTLEFLVLGKFFFGFKTFFRASYGREYGKIQERIKQEFKSITRGFWRSSVYKLIGRPHFLRKYHDDFEGTMDYIPSNPQSAEDYEKYSTALDYFGGFFQGLFFSFLTFSKLIQSLEVKLNHIPS
jgi:hypothetical protein